MGHIVSHEGVKIDSNKIKSNKEWKIPTTIKHLQGFLVLVWYYQKCFKNYGRITTSIATLFIKYVFCWTLEETKAFNHPKEEMCQALVFAMPNFTKPFIVECDPS